MSKKALFLDRDGIINREINYLIRPEDVEFLPGIFDLTRAYQDRGYLIIVITNQAGIGRGYYTEEDFSRLTTWIEERFLERGIHLTATYYCPDHPVHGLGQYKRETPDRKPGPGMILKALKEFTIDPNQSLFLGDRETDMLAAYRAGIPERILLDPGRKEPTDHSTRIISSLSEIMP